MTDNQFTKFIRELVRGCNDLHKLRGILKNKGFYKIGEGAYKKTYYNDNYPYWVVKVFKEPGIWYGDHSTCGIIPKEIQPYWLKNIFVSRRFIIQPFANEKGGTDEEANQWFKEKFNGQEYPKFDVYINNTKYHNGKVVLIDFTERLKKRHPQFRRPRLTSIYK